MSFLRRRPKRYRFSPAGQLLINDVEAYLSGNYEEYTRKRGCEVPAWCRLNFLAHGDIQQIQEFACAEPSAGRRVDDPDNESWLDMQRLLARQLLAITGDSPAVLDHVQHACLIPLERRLIQESSSGGIGALEIAQAAQNVLRSVS